MSPAFFNNPVALVLLGTAQLRARPCIVVHDQDTFNVMNHKCNSPMPPETTTPGLPLSESETQA